MNKESVLILVSLELDRATNMYPKFTSIHEGWGIIREEYLELEDEIRKTPNDHTTEKMRREAIHLGAMALRFIMDVT